MRRLSVSLPDRLFQEAEGLAAQMGVSRNQLYANALVEFLEAHQGDLVTKAINRVCETENTSLDPALKTLQNAVFARDPW